MPQQPDTPLPRLPVSLVPSEDPEGRLLSVGLILLALWIPLADLVGLIGCKLIQAVYASFVTNGVSKASLRI